MKKALIVALSLVLVMVISAIGALSLIVFGIEDEPQVEVVESVQPVEDSFSWEGMTQEEVLQQMLMYGSVYISAEDSEIWLNDAIRNVENSNFEYRKTMLDILYKWRSSNLGDFDYWDRKALTSMLKGEDPPPYYQGLGG